jgi:16S rRNA (adenine1518-N6/adenine1519-N6)-dimethyltransferase
MNNVRPKKHLGQHFLNDDEIAARIADSLVSVNHPVLEIGPGMGILTRHLIAKHDLYAIDIDTESIAYLRHHFPSLQDRIIEGDFLHYDLGQHFAGKLSLIGNFPYNISSQILFRALENRDQVHQVVGMFQKEVAERIASGPGNRDYGILSVFMQAFYDIEYLFTVPEHVFTPPPRVKSGVIRCVRNDRQSLDCDEQQFKRVVKAGFNQRRKTLRNALKTLLPPNASAVPFLDARAETLSWHDFVVLTNSLRPA